MLVYERANVERRRQSQVGRYERRPLGRRLVVSAWFVASFERTRFGPRRTERETGDGHFFDPNVPSDELPRVDVERSDAELEQVGNRRPRVGDYHRIEAYLTADRSEPEPGEFHSCLEQTFEERPRGTLDDQVLEHDVENDHGIQRTRGHRLLLTNRLGQRQPLFILADQQLSRLLICVAYSM
jgi:hypothetical protein